MSERGINPLDLSLEQLSAYRTQVIRTTIITIFFIIIFTFIFMMMMMIELLLDGRRA